MSRVQIRLLKNHEDFRACEHIQKAVWGALGAGSEVMTVTQKYGGAVLGALVGGRMIGFLCAFLARRHGQIIHWSQMMAVLPEYRDRGLGFRMKLAHRQFVLQQGLASICWTYDPLQSRNATLNISRLGAQVEEYIQDYYGPFPSVIEKGLASDRFVVNWRVVSPAVERRLKEGPPQPVRFGTGPRPGKLPFPPVNEARFNAKGLLQNRRIFFNLREPRVLVEIPAHTDTIRERSIDLARRWRMETRHIFQRYFRAAYRVEGFVPPSPDNDGRCFYILHRQRLGQ